MEFGVKPDSVDVFEAVRQRNVEVGILTELGREGGWVAFHPCPFYGRLIGEIACTLNDALRRLEGRTSFFVAQRRGRGSTPVLPGVEKRYDGVARGPGRHHSLL